MATTTTRPAVRYRCADERHGRGPGHRPRHDPGEGRADHAARRSAGHGPGRLRDPHPRRRARGAGPERTGGRRSVSAVSDAVRAAGAPAGGPSRSPSSGRGPRPSASPRTAARCGPPSHGWTPARRTITAELVDRLGVPSWQLGPLPHERWLAEHEPEVHARAAAFLLPWDWLTMRLTGETIRSVPHGLTPPGRRGHRGGRWRPRAVRAVGGVGDARGSVAAGSRRGPVVALGHPDHRRGQRRPRELPRRGHGRRRRGDRHRRDVRRLRGLLGPGSWRSRARTGRHPRCPASGCTAAR